MCDSLFPQSALIPGMSGVWWAQVLSRCFSVNVRMYKMSGPLSSHSNWIEMKFPNPPSALWWITHGRKKKGKSIPPTLLILWEPVWLHSGGRAELPRLIFWRSWFVLFSARSRIPVCFTDRSLKTRVKIMVDGTLLISRLVPEDSGNYTCVPSNGLLTPPTASANLTVMRTFSL